MRRGSVRLSVYAFILAGATLLLVALGIAAVRPAQTTFNVTAQSERVEIFMAEEPRSRWVLDSVEVREDHAAESREFTGSFLPGDSVQVLVERVALGPLYVHVESRATPQQSAGRYYAANDEPAGEAAGIVEFVVPDPSARAANGETVVLALQGAVRTGRPVGVEAPGSTALLRGGSVSLLGRSLLDRDVFEAGGVELAAGEFFDVPDPISPAVGFLAIDERPAMTAAYRVLGRSGTVVRPGGGSYSLSVSPAKRLLNDRLLVQVFSGVAALLALGASLAGLAMEYRNFRRERT